MEGLEIKARRQALGWTQQDLADRSKVTTRTIQRWEDGETAPENMKLLLSYVFENAEKGDKISPSHQQIIYISKEEIGKKGVSEVLIRII